MVTVPVVSILNARVRTLRVQYRSMVVRVIGMPGSSVALLVVLQRRLHSDGGALLDCHQVEVVAQLSPVCDGRQFRGGERSQ